MYVYIYNGSKRECLQLHSWKWRMSICILFGRVDHKTPPVHNVTDQRARKASRFLLSTAPLCAADRTADQTQLSLRSHSQDGSGQEMPVRAWGNKVHMQKLHVY